MKKRLSLTAFGLCLILCLTLFWGCASPGPKYLDLTYTRDHSATQTGKTVGLTRLSDKRGTAAKGYVGHRVLLNNNRETFVVTGQDLSATLTRIVRTYLEKNGFTVQTAPAWPLTAAGVAQADNGFDRLLAGDINRFECRAVKSGATTDMVLSIDLTLYLGNPDQKRLKTIPIALNLERTELTFSRKKLETFMNQSVEEILLKALPF